MITKERLNELIEKGAMIYTPDDFYQTIGRIKLNKKCYFKNNRLNNNDITFEDLPNAIAMYSIPFEELYETKEEAEWYLEFGNIQRTETLSLPSWKEAKEKMGSVMFYIKTGNILFGVSDDKTRIFIQSDETLFDKSLTKENYTEACRLAKKLFLGEKE